MRKPIRTILDRGIALREPTKPLASKRDPDSQFERDAERLNHLVMYDVATGKVVGSVDRDDLFDEDGNRFQS